MTIYVATLDMARKFMVDSAEGAIDPILDTHYKHVESFDQNFEDILESLRDDLDAIVAAASSIAKDFDGPARVAIHKNLSALSPMTLHNPDFWRYLAAVHFPDIVLLRHPKSAKSKTKPGEIDANWANYAAQTFNVRESLFHRLFTGASLAVDANNVADPYNLCAIHDVDLWQSHIIRVLTGENRIYVRALLTWFKDRDGWYARNGFAQQAKVAKFRTEHIRDFVKRIRRLRSNVMHETLTESEIVDLVDCEALHSAKYLVLKYPAPATS